uniref:Tc1-like transposase DDE domain-containing protein n=1 Tax=Oncorhynchus kisutch TaxID=8019 RepID=A0A8C7K1G0_ONCKI
MRFIQKWLVRIGELKLDWPAQSRDLNPVKYLWDDLERQLRARPNRPTSVMLFLLTLDGVCRVSILLYWDTAVPVHTAVCQYVIKRRFTTVLVVSALSPPVLKAWADWVGITVN